MFLGIPVQDYFGKAGNLPYFSCFYHIAAALRTIPTIKELYIGDNNLQPSDGIQLGNLLRNNIHLHTLDIKGNHLQVRTITIRNMCV